MHNIDNMLPPVMLMPLQPSLVITEEPTLIQETLSLHDHKKIEVKKRVGNGGAGGQVGKRSVDEEYIEGGGLDIYNTNEVIYSQINQRYKVPQHQYTNDERFRDSTLLYSQIDYKLN